MSDIPSKPDPLPAKADASSAPVLSDCWDKVGTGGDRSCPELESYIHCRNCPVYSDAALQLLSRPLSIQHRSEWTDHYAQVQKVSTLGKISVVIFRVGFEWLALPTRAFVEIAEHRKIHSIPHRRGGVLLGLVNIRGELTVCVSLARLLDLEDTAMWEKKLRTIYDRLVVVNWDGHQFVFPADEVFGIQRLQSDEIKEPPAMIGRGKTGYVQGILSWREKTVGVLDGASLFAALNRSLA